ncbi:putative EGF-like domain-containing protein [Helianthus debilis subsp. tardiflorus]
MPIVVDWVIAPNKTCATEVVNECQENSSCYDVEGGRYRCICDKGYHGNPYLHPGCQDIDECSDLGTYPCHGICVNTVGSYTCTCERGTSGDAYTLNGCKEIAKDTIHLVLIIGNFSMQISTNMFMSTTPFKRLLINCLFLLMHMCSDCI